MFNSNKLIVGKHAYFIKELSPRDNVELRVFDRYIDVYIIGAIIGYINGLKEDRDTESEFKAQTANIFLDAIQKERTKLEFIYRTIMLLDDGTDLSEDARVNRAFRDDLMAERNDNHKENMNLFNSYVRGGITFLYENLLSDAYNRDERISNIIDFVVDFNNDFIREIYTEDIDYERV